MIQLTELRQEIITLRMAQREMGRELRSVLSIHPVPTEAELGQHEKLWMHAVTLAAEAYSVAPGKVLSRERTDQVAAARQFALWLCVKVAGWGWSHCGRITNRNHGTVMWAVKQHNNAMNHRRARGFSLEQDEAEVRFRAYVRDHNLTPPPTTQTEPTHETQSH